MAFHIRRIKDNITESGGRSQAITWDDNGVFKEVVSHIPTVGCSILVRSAKYNTITSTPEQLREWFPSAYEGGTNE